jgi:hypothetical protein
MSMLRRLRGLAGLAIVGSVVWVSIGLTIIAIETTLRGQAVAWDMAPELAVVGAAFGVVFGLVLSVMERRRAFEGLTIGRMALWGALGGLAIRAALIAFAFVHTDVAFAIVNFALYGIVGAVTSAGTLALARRAPALAPAESVKELGSA